MIAGNTAPPRIAITRSDDPRFVSEPRFLMLSAKIVGNMMEWKKPISTIAYTGSTPEANSAIVAQSRAATANNKSNRRGGIFFPRPEPINRPAMNPNWCRKRYSAATFAVVPGTENCAKRITKLATPTCAPTYTNCANTPRNKCPWDKTLSLLLSAAARGASPAGASSTSGRCAKYMSTATTIKIPAMKRYGPFTVLASELRYASNCAPVIAAICAGANSTPVRINLRPTTEEITAPSALNDCAKFNLRSALAAGPRIVMYGFAATSKKLCPQAITNSAKRKNSYTREEEAGRKSTAPVAQIHTPARIPFLYPIFSITHPAGNAARKYPPKNATWMNEDWKSVRPNAFFKCGIRMSLRLTPNAQRKKRLVMSTKGIRNRRSVTGTDRPSSNVFPAADAIRSSALSERAIQMRVACVHKHVLPGDVARLSRNQIHNHGRNFFRRRHPPSQGDLGNNVIQLRLRSRKNGYPLLIERSHPLGGNKRVHANSVRQKFRSPFARESKNRGFCGHVSRGSALPGDGRLRTDVDDGTARNLQRGQRKMRHRIVMVQIAFQRDHKFLGRAILEADVVVDSHIIYQRIEAAVFPQRLFHQICASIRSSDLAHDRFALHRIRSQRGHQLRRCICVAVEENGNRAFRGGCAHNGRADSLCAACDENHFFLESQVHELSVKIHEATIKQIVRAGDESGFVGTKKQRERRDFFRLSHPADRLRLRQLFVHFRFAPRIIFPQIVIHKRSVHARRRNAVAADIVGQIIARHGIRHCNHGAFARGIRKAVGQPAGASDRSHVEDRAAAFFLHVSNGGLHAVVVALHVDAK